jgi:hypothetical protein
MRRLALILIGFLILWGCGSSSSKSTTPITPAVLSITTTTVPNGTVGTAYSQTIQTTGGTMPLTWTVSAGSLPAGLSMQAGTGGAGTLSGTPTTAGSYTFTLTATDSSSSPQTASQQFTIVTSNPSLNILTTSLPSGVLNTAYSATLQASGGITPYIWSVASGSSLPSWMSLTSSGTTWTLAGTPSATGTSNFSVLLTDSSTPTAQTKTQALSVTITSSASACGSGNESVLSGQYAFSLSGFNASGYMAAIGSFTADGNGHITAGTLDANGMSLGVHSGSIAASSSSYSIGSDYRGCATIATPFYTFTTRFVLDPASGHSAGNIQEWESGSMPFIAAGQIFHQSVPSSLPNGTWVYQHTGVFGSGASRTGAIGTLTSSSGSFTAGEYDSNAAGTHHSYSGLSGTYTSVNQTTGRFTTTTALSGITAHRAAYMLSGTQFLELTTDTLGSTTSILYGRAQLQSGSLSLSGNLILYATGVETTGVGSIAQLGRVTITGSSSLTANIYEDDSGTWKTPTPSTPSCSYTIDSYGKVATSGSNCGTYPPVFYLTSSNTGVMLGTDPEVMLGQVVPQSATSITAGNYYFGLPVATHLNNATTSGVLVLAGSGAVTGTTDTTSIASPLQATQSLTDNLTVNTDGSFSTATHAGVVSGLIISPSQLVVVDSPGSSYPTVLVVNH